MRVACPKEIKNNENRVGLTPAGAKALVAAGHQVFLEQSAGEGSGFSDQEYVHYGAQILRTADEAFAQGELIIKVKEPQKNEIEKLHKGQVLFTYLHLAPDAAQTEGLLKSQATAIAYETITDQANHLPLLTPMSEVAGRMSVQVGAQYLQKTMGGRGMLLGGVPGVPPAHVLIIGGGVVGINAIKMAIGLGARVTVLDRSLPQLRYLDDVFGSSIETLWSSQSHLEETLPSADLVIGAVLVPGASAPKLITKAMLKLMKKGSVIVDVAVDQGGCVETTHPTTHADPVYVVDDILHYSVANMPGAVPRTSTIALTNATLPYALTLANLGWKKALAADSGFLLGLNTHEGNLTCKPVALEQKRPYTPPETLLT